MRLDKMLGKLGYGTRSEIKKMCRQGMVTVNGQEAKKPDQHINPDQDQVCLNGQEVSYREYIYLMMNKPAGCVSATFDRYDQTVIDLIDPEYLAFDPFPVGRLDKDTEGLLVITNDGQLSHRVLSPKKHVPKKYYAQIDQEVVARDIEAFSKGLYIGDDCTTRPAKLEIIRTFEADDGRLGSEIYVTISEGKFHQVKRMFEAVGKQVLYLKRVQMGSLSLDESLELGQYRELTEEEVKLLEDREI